MAENLDLEQIQQCLSQECELIWFEKTDSTNEQALLAVKQMRALPLACFAEEQAQGRGRRGKVWISPPRANIYLSLAWSFDLPANELGCLSLAMGVAVARVLNGIGLSSCRLKWPNDVLFDGKKIAGILIETTQLAAKKTTAIIGIGLNFELSETLSVKPEQAWVDVVSLLRDSPSSCTIGRSELAGLLLQECMHICDNFAQTRNALMVEYQRYDICRQQAVNVYLEDEVLQGVALGVEASGEIRVLIDGEQRLFNSANISLRKASNVND